MASQIIYITGCASFASVSNVAVCYAGLSVEGLFEDFYNRKK